MRKRRLIIAMAAVFVTVATVLTSFILNNTKVEASSSQLDITFEVYEGDDYTAYATQAEFWSGWDDDFDSWAKTADPDYNYDDYNGDGKVTIEDIKLGIAAGDYSTIAQAFPNASEADSYWALTSGKKMIKAKKQPSVNAFTYYGGYPHDILGSDYTGTAGPTKPVQTTEFEPEKYVAILVYAQGDNTNTAVFAIDQELRTASGDKILEGAAAYPGTRLDGYFDTAKQDPSVTSNADASGKFYQLVGGQFSSSSDKTSDKILLGGIYFQIDKDAVSGDYKLNNVVSALNTQWAVVTSTGVTTYNLNQHPGKFNIQSKTIKVESSNPTGNSIKSIDINTNGCAKKDTTVGTISLPIDASTGMPASGATSYEYWVPDFDSTGADATKQFEYVKITESSATILPKVEGTITKVSYSTDLTKALSSWTAVSKGATGYTIPASTVGESPYVAIDVDSPDGTISKTYILCIPKEAYHVAELTGFTIGTVNTSTSGATKWILDPSPFVKTTTGYTVKLPADVTNVSFSVTYDTSKKMKVIIDGTTTVLSSGGSETFNFGSNSTLSIKVTAQDGTTDETYTFTKGSLSNDVSLTLTESYGANYDATSKKYTINNVPYHDTKLTYQVSNTTKATITAGSSTTDINGKPNQTLTYVVNGYALSQTIETFTVTSESGLTETYTLEVNRDAADTDCKLDTTATKVYDNAGNEITGSWDSVGTTWTAAANQPYKKSGSIVTGFYVVPVGHTDNGSYYTMEVGSTAVTSGNHTPTTNFTKYLDDDAKSLVVTVKAENKNVSQPYTFNVTRDKADDTKTMTFEVFDVTNGGNTDITSKFTGTTTITNNDGSATGANLDSSIKDIKLVIKPDATSATAIVDPTGSKTDITTAGVYTFTLKQSKNIETTTVVVRITPESDNYQDYTFKFIAEKLSTENRLAEIKVIGKSDSDTSSYNYLADPGKYDFEYKMDFDVNKEYYLNATARDASKSELYYSTNLNADSDLDTLATKFTNGVVCDVGTKYYIFVKPETGTIGRYVVDVGKLDKRDKNNKINSIVIATLDKNGVETTQSWTFHDAVSGQDPLTIPYTAVQLKFYVTLDSTAASLVTPSQTYANALNGFVVNSHAIVHSTDTVQKYIFQAQAENETVGTKYEVNITREAPKTGNDIDILEVDGNAADLIDTDTFVYRTNRTNTSANITVTLSDGATFEANKTSSSAIFKTTSFTINGLIAGKATIINFRVKSEEEFVDNKSSSHNYTLYIFNADNTNVIDNIRILEDTATGDPLKDVDGNTYAFSSTTPIAFNISYAAKNPYFEVTHTTSPRSVITGDGARNIAQNKLNDVPQLVEIKSTSEYGSLLKAAGFTVPSSEEITYKFNMKRLKASAIKTLEELKFEFPGDPTKNVTFTKSDLASLTSYSFENLGASANVTISYIKSDMTAIVGGLTTSDSKTSKTGSSTESFTIAQNTSVPLNIKVKAENDDENGWTFYFAYTDAVLDGTSDISMITLTGDVDTADVLGFNPTVDPYSVKLSGKNKVAKIKVDLASSKSTLKIDGNSWNPIKTKEIPIEAGKNTDVLIECVSQDGKSTTQYHIEIVCEGLDTISTLKSLIEKQGTGPDQAFAGFVPDDSTQTSYTVTVPNDVTTYVLKPTPTSSKATIDSNSASDITPLTLKVGENTAIINVKAEDGSSTPYTIKIIRKASLKLSSLVVLDGTDNLITFTGTDTYTASKKLPYTTDSVTVNAVAEDATNTEVVITGNTNIPEGVASVISIKVIDKVTKEENEYQVNIVRQQGDSNTNIISYVTEDGDTLSSAALTANPIVYCVKPSTSVFDPQIEVATSSQVILPTDKTLSQGKNDKKVIVKAENGDEKEYTFTIYCASKDVSIEDIVVLDSDGAEINGLADTKVRYSKDDLDYELTIPYTNNSITIKVTKGQDDQYIYIDATQDDTKTVSPEVGKTTTYRIYALSEYGYLSGDSNSKSDTYKIRVTRLPQETDSRLKTLVVSAGGQVLEFNKAFDSDEQEYIIENIGNTITNVDVTATPVKESTKITGNKNWVLDATYGEGNYIFTITVVGTAESGDQTEYKITIARGQLDLSTEKNINYLTLVDSNGKTYITDTEDWASSNYVKTVTVSYGPQSVTFTANKLSVSKSTIYFTENNVVKKSSQTDTSYMVNIDPKNVNSVYLGKTVVFKVYSQAEKADENGNIYGQVYTINVTFEAPSTDASLIELTVGDFVPVGFDPAKIDGVNGTQYSYTLEKSMEHKKDTVKIVAKPKESSTIITGTGEKILHDGQNIFTVTATAENGHQINYIITVDRDEEDPYLFKLEIDGETLLNAAGTSTKFSQTVYEYYARVLNTVTSVAIIASSPNISYTVSTTNSTIREISVNGLVRTFDTNGLVVGDNTFYVTVASSSNSDKKTVYTLNIFRRDALSADTGVTSLSLKQVDAKGIKTEVSGTDFTFDDKISEYSFTVANTVKKLDFALNLANNGDQTDANGEKIEPATFEIIGNDEGLKTGDNKVFVLVRAADGVTTRLIQFNVNREPYEFTISSPELTKLKDDYENDVAKPTYNVASKVTSFSVTGQNLLTNNDSEQPVISITNNGKLNPGENKLTIYITAPDGTVVPKEITVNRANMSYTVNKTAYTDFACENGTQDRYYTINLIDKPASAITDYAKYIEFAEDCDLDVEVLTNTALATTNEVLIRVSTKDKAESEIVHFQLTSSAINPTGTWFDILFWIILGITIVLLTIILICVNRDKYGSISKKRKNA